jgi:Zn-dependent peptidase ImmA (M78 family)/transcriptional regulator with XRE-family HTH domain
MSSNNWHLVAYQFNPEALRMAREIRRLQKIELAAELGVTPSAITQFENGTVRPNAQTVGRMCMSLQFPASFFADKSVIPTVSAERCHFRRLQSSSQTERRQMVAVSTIIARLIAYIDERIDLPVEQVTPYVVDRPYKLEEIENIACTLRRAWGLGLGPIGNLVELLESKGIFVFRLLDDCERVDAFSLFLERRPVIFLNTHKGSTSRSRFDAAHELGHLIMHTDCKPGDPAQEDEANHFASSFLMPRETFLPECPHRLVWNHFRALKTRWGVSLAALVRRARDLGRISDHTYRRAYLQINQQGWRQAEPDEPPVEWPSILTQAFDLLAQSGVGFGDVASALSVSEKDLHRWAYADFVPAAEQTGLVIPWDKELVDEP